MQKSNALEKHVCMLYIKIDIRITQMKINNNYTCGLFSGVKTINALLGCGYQCAIRKKKTQNS